MYYISNIINGKYGITDTKDNVEEFYTEQEVLDLSKKFKIYGVSGNIIFSIKAKALQYEFSGFGFRCNIDEDDIVLTRYIGTASDFDIPDFITKIDDSAFSWCDDLTSITIPDSVTSIGDGVFIQCDSLTSITIPDSVTSISNRAFWYCKNLTSIEIPNSVTSIGDYAFNECTWLTSITIPDSVTSIGNQAFHSCTSLTSIILPDSVTSIGDRAFASCESLTSIEIPSSVTSIGKFAFIDCNSLSTIKYLGTKEQFISLIIDNPNDEIIVNCSDGNLIIKDGVYETI